MREIKFRGWYTNALGNIMLEPEFHGPINKIFNDNRNRVVYMQYTGLKDKNGREIYEGDILDSESEGYPFVKNWVGVVKFIDGSFLLENLQGTDGDWLFNESVEREVIGNIYENPELLEVQP